MSDFRIKTCVLGAVSTNCYLVYNDRTREAVIVDPAANGPYILNKCRELGITPVGMFLTHGHFDHILAVPDLKRSFGSMKVYALAEEGPLLEDPRQNLTYSFQGNQISLRPDVELHDGEELELLGFRWKVLSTPGHTAGSACYYLPDEEVLLSGDTLFQESYGRTDLPTGSSRQMVKSILEVLFELPDGVMVYPGHGDPTTMEHEKQRNPLAAYK